MNDGDSQGAQLTWFVAWKASNSDGSLLFSEDFWHRRGTGGVCLSKPSRVSRVKQSGQRQGRSERCRRTVDNLAAAGTGAR